MKYRRNKVKREHGIIQNALLWLENLSRLSEVTDIIPGVIHVSHSSERGIVYKYETQTGCKILLKSNGSIQEAFVVTKNPARVQEWVEKEFPADPPATESQVKSQTNQQEELRRKSSNLPLKQQKGSEVKSSQRQHCSKKRVCKKASKSTSRNLDTSNISDRLDSSTLKALSHLKKLLEEAKIQNVKLQKTTIQDPKNGNFKTKHKKFQER